MTHNKVVATELSNLGFTTQLTQTGVLVSLNRRVEKLEVQHALSQAFEGIEFPIYPISKNTYHVITGE